MDDILVVGSNMHNMNVLKMKLAKSYAMKDLGVAKQYPWYENNKR